MFRLSYSVGSTVVESYNFPNRALAVWKKNQLFNQGTHSMGTFKINKV
jgi:hypothetical protein